MKEELRGERKLGFVNARSANEFEMFSKIKAKYPTWTKIMSSIAATVKVNTALAEFLVAIIEHTEEIFDSAPVRQKTDYIERIIFNSMFEFCQEMIRSILDSILLYPRFNSKYYSIKKKSADSIQKIIIPVR